LFYNQIEFESLMLTLHLDRSCVKRVEHRSIRLKTSFSCWPRFYRSLCSDSDGVFIRWLLYQRCGAIDS